MKVFYFLVTSLESGLAVFGIRSPFETRPRRSLIVPRGQRWDDLFFNGPRVSDDFMADRQQPAAETRESF